MVLHTVLTRPTANQHRVLAELVGHASAMVTMTTTARDRLVAGWGVDPALVSVIPHGAENNLSPISPLPNAQVRRRRVLTWGLLSEGKGIEWALLGLAQLRRRTVPLPDYAVVGQTHPRVLERDGEAYRDRLVHETVDVTQLVREGENVLSATLAGAWYTEKYGFFAFADRLYGTQPSFLAQLRVTFDDGTTTTVAATGEGWEAASEGPIVDSGIYAGEHQDLRRAVGGFSPVRSRWTSRSTRPSSRSRRNSDASRAVTSAIAAPRPIM